MSIFFISDLHLSPRQPVIATALTSFLKGTAAAADHLYILGDFFDAWIGDDDDDRFVQQIKEQLHTYSRSHPVSFLQGNRDFLIGDQFARDTGVQLLAEESIIDLFGRKTLLMHGDTLCTDDVEYLEFRQMVRSPAWQQQVLSLPLSHRRALAADLRNKSKSMNAMKAEDIMDVSGLEVERVMQVHDVDLLVHGHTHRPARHQVALPTGQAERIVLGDWGALGWYLRVDHNGASQLESFPIDVDARA